ncbi:MAG: hypothetical protein ACI4AM_05775, partial [Muribaculaceae bacterium]
MELNPTLSAVVDVARAIAAFELQLDSAFGLNLAEAMTLTAVAGEQLPATAVSDRTHLRPSHLSKVIATLRRRNLLTTTRTKPTAASACSASPKPAPNSWPPSAPTPSTSRPSFAPSFRPNGSRPQTSRRQQTPLHPLANSFHWKLFASPVVVVVIYGCNVSGGNIA